MCVAIRYLTYGASVDIWGEYLCLNETSSLKSVKKNFKAIVAIIRSEYARQQTTTDVARLCEQNAARGFSGMHRLYSLKMEELSNSLVRFVHGS